MYMYMTAVQLTVVGAGVGAGVGGVVGAWQQHNRHVSMALYMNVYACNPHIAAVVAAFMLLQPSCCCSLHAVAAFKSMIVM
jgi:hypothetical protein